MLSSIDGRIDGKILDNVIAGGEYEATGAKLKGNAWICGRTTMQLQFADKKPFVVRSRKASGPRPVFIAKRAKSFAIAVDTIGKLRWTSDDIYVDHLICIVSERVPLEYLDRLRRQGISYIVADKSTVDLTTAVQLLRRHFGIKRLLLEGGGNINGAFLKPA
jgi:riboflavin biosynthesis pyrimidine reductase